MAIIQTKCSNCGSSFSYDNLREKVFCTSCGTRYINNTSSVTMDEQYNGIARNLREEYTTQLYLYGLKERIRKSYNNKRNLIIPLIICVAFFILSTWAFLALPVMLMYVFGIVVGFVASILIVAKYAKYNKTYKQQVQELNEYSKYTKEIRSLFKNCIDNGTFGDEAVKMSLEESMQSRTMKMQTHLSQNDIKSIELIEKIPDLKNRQYNTEEEVLSSINNMSSLIMIAAKSNPGMISSYGFYLLTLEFCQAIVSLKNRTSNNDLAKRLLELAQKHSSLLIKEKSIKPEARNHMQKLFSQYESDIHSLTN